MSIVVSKLDCEGNKAIKNTKRHEKVRQPKAEEMRSNCESYDYGTNIKKYFNIEICHSLSFVLIVSAHPHCARTSCAQSN